MLSIQKNFLFIHVPKTGGNSIQLLLSEYSEDEIVTLADHHDGIERFELRRKNYKLHKHSTLSDYKSALSRDLYRDLFKFAVIRNPWDRMISHYFSPHRGKSTWDRDEFLKLVEQAPTLDYYVRKTSFFERFLARLLGKPIERTDPLDKDIDLLLRFESLDTDFAQVCSILDIPRSPLPKRNVSSRRHYTHYYDEQTREIVRRKFANEINFGNYDFL